MEGYDRIRPLNSIKTEEEYKIYQEYLNRYLTEYKWFSNSKEPLESIKNKALKYEVNSDARIALENRGRLIESGDYGPALERNIAAYMLTLEEYEAKKENRSLFDVLKGILSKDADTQDYLKRRYMKSRAEDSGLQVIEPVNLSLQGPYDSIKEIFENNSFINIQPPEMALVPVDTEVNEIFDQVREMLDACLDEVGIKRMGNDGPEYRNDTLRAEKINATGNTHPNTHDNPKEGEIEK